MTDVFLYETRQFLEQLEQMALTSEDNGEFAADDVNEIFRAMHTIKGSAAMMSLTEISQLAHAVEDIFFYIRELHPAKVDVSAITDIVLTAVDFMSGEMDKLAAGETPDRSSAELRQSTQSFLREMKLANGDDPDVDLRKAKAGPAKKQAAATAAATPPAAADKPAAVQPAAGTANPAGKLHIYSVNLHFEPDCGMVEVRAFGVLDRMKNHMAEVHYRPEKLLEDEQAPAQIMARGFELCFTSPDDEKTIRQLLDETSFVEGMELEELPDTKTCEFWPAAPEKPRPPAASVAQQPQQPQRSAARKGKAKAPAEHEMISVRVDKLDRLMDLVGELVIAESMVTQNPDIRGLELSNFAKAARQLHKINEELQDSVMSLRMVPLEGPFKKMNRIVRDMTKKLGKKARLALVGEDTEVDKKIAEGIADPLMHIVRNSVDHGIEMPEARKAAGKPEQGTVTLSARNEGGEVIIEIRDDGGGMDRDKILHKAQEKGLLTKPAAEYTDREAYNFIFAPGFSTKEQVTEFSGRGVGMDVVMANIKGLGGRVSVDSRPGRGSVTVIRIPLTLAIIDGMCLRVGESYFTVPISAVKRSFRPEAGQIFLDSDGQEMIMERQQCCPVVRLGQIYHLEGAEDDAEQAVLMLVENDGHLYGLLADELLGVQQIVVKPVPSYIKKLTTTTGITGCTLFGDGSISLIIDPAKLGGLIFS